ncbi:MAG: hypothetical protein J0L82_10285 [Deltaproteobacteria bacterium]|jgi:hypothetical protein|nr:hypothetical protein [Deltaproteobacteria bacterium]
MSNHFFNEIQQVYREQVNWMSDLTKIRNEVTADYASFVETETLEFTLLPGGMATSSFDGPSGMGLVKFQLECEDSQKFLNLVRMRIRPNDEFKDLGEVSNEVGCSLVYLVDDKETEDEHLDDEEQDDVNKLVDRVLELLPKVLFDQNFYRAWGPAALPKSAFLRVSFQRLNFERLINDFASVHVEENLRQLLLRTPFPILSPTFLQSEIRAQAALISMLHSSLSSFTRLDSKSAIDEVRLESFELSSAPAFETLETPSGPQYAGVSIVSVAAPMDFVQPIEKFGDEELHLPFDFLFLGICNSLSQSDVLRTLFGEDRFSFESSGTFQFDYFPSNYFSQNPGSLKVDVLKIPASVFTADEAAGKSVEANLCNCLTQHFKMLEESVYTSNVI